MGGGHHNPSPSARSIVFDRMLTADVTAHHVSQGKPRPLVARESLMCGTPVVSVDVGEVGRYLPEEWVHEDDPEALADGIEHALRHGWQSEDTVDERLAFASFEAVSQAWTGPFQPCFVKAEQRQADDPPPCAGDQPPTMNDVQTTAKIHSSLRATIAANSPLIHQESISNTPAERLLAAAAA